MTYHSIETGQDFKDLLQYVEEHDYVTARVSRENSSYRITFEQHEQFIIQLSSFNEAQLDFIHQWAAKFNEKRLVFGKDETTHIVSCEVKGEEVELFIEKDGELTSKTIPHRYWIVSCRKFDSSWQTLKGNLYYRFIKAYSTKEAFYLDKNKYKTSVFAISDPKESSMVLNGFTYYKGMKVSDVSCLFFDIESTGLQHNDASKVLLISNTFLKNGKVERKLFDYKSYDNDAGMFDAWCKWVRQVNPSILCGHNIFSYDLPYMCFCATRAGTTLNLGRDGSDIRFERHTSKFRKDGSQDYEYKRCYIYGREIVDTMFLAYHFDFGRKYESYALKQIIKQEGLEVKNRQFYDAGKIWENYLIPEEWEKIKKYAEHDADDAMALYNLMIPAYFYLTPSIPKSFQTINYSATGSQINAFLIRSYLQDGHSLPKASEAVKFPGAISDGLPGRYKNVFKVDVASLYPSVMLQYQVYDKDKDPSRHFLQMVQYFTKERLANKKKAKDTGERYYKELEQAQKIVINSAYGLLGSTGLLFNSPKNAALVTEHGREILKKAILWATGSEYVEKVPEEEKDEDT